MDRAHRTVRWTAARTLVLAVGVLLAVASGAAAELVSVGDIRVAPLGQALKDHPVQVAGHPDPALSRRNAVGLTLQIARVDPGRIRIAIVSPLTQQASGDLGQALSDAVNTDGVVIVVAGSSYHVTTTWGTGDQAQSILADAVSKPGASLYTQMRRAVDGFAKADARDGHPKSSGEESTTSTGQATLPDESVTAGPSRESTTGQSSSGSSAGLIVGLIVLGLVVVLVLLRSGPRIRRSMQSSHRRKLEAADAHEQAQSDFSKLGEDIEALDIDSSMPTASAQGKDEYSRAIECYQDAEKRLAKSDDSYQFERALDALRRGHEHVAAAGQLFAASSPPTRDPNAAADEETINELARLATLHKSGALTDAEFAEQKRKLIGS